MGRFTKSISPLFDSPVAVSGGKFFGAVDEMSAGDTTGLSMSTATLSMTQTVTLLALTGPGVLNFFSAQIRTGDGSGTRIEWRLIIDDETCFSATYSTGNTWNTAVLVGHRYELANQSQRLEFDQIPFNKSVLITARGPHPSLWLNTATSWRLTDG